MYQNIILSEKKTPKFQKQPGIKSFTLFLHKIYSNEDSELPIIAYYGTKRAILCILSKNVGKLAQT